MVEGLVLYHFEGCPYCTLVRREIDALGLAIEMRDIRKNAVFHDELVRGGGKKQVPCLRIENAGGPVTWLYESQDIAAYLCERFG